MNKVVIIASNSITISNFFLRHISMLQKDNLVYLICNIKNTNFNIPKNNLEIINIKYKRKINLIIDLINLFKTIYFLNKISPKLVISLTPKCGFINSITSKLFNYKAIHIFTGQHWVKRNSIFKIIYKKIDLSIINTCNVVLFDSHSQLKFITKELNINSNHLHCLGHGSIQGVNIEKFKFNKKKYNLIRNKFNIKPNEKVILFIGRICKDKGVFDLIDAFSILKKKHRNIKLMFVGMEEENISSAISESNILSEDVIKVDYTDNPELYFISCDIFCLPSYREGFGNVVLEASSASKPVVASDIYGLKDIAKNDSNALTFQTGNINDLAHKLSLLIQNQNLCEKLGLEGRKISEKHFNEKEVVIKYNNFFKKYLLNEKNI